MSGITDVDGIKIDIAPEIVPPAETIDEIKARLLGSVPGVSRTPKPAKLAPILVAERDEASNWAALEALAPHGPFWAALEGVLLDHAQGAPLEDEWQTILRALGWCEVHYGPLGREKPTKFAAEVNRLRMVADLVRDLRQTRSDSHDHRATELRIKLRKFAPPWAIEAHNRELKNAVRPIERELSQAQTRAEELRGLIRSPYAKNSPSIIAICEKLPEDHIAYPQRIYETSVMSRSEVSVDAWAVVVFDARSELNELEPRITDLAERVAVAEREAASVLDCYE